MLRILLSLYLISPNTVKAELLTRGISANFLRKIRQDGEIKNTFINAESKQVGFNTDTKLWVWNISANQMKSVQVRTASPRSSEIKDIHFFNSYWIVEGHNKLTFINIADGSKRTINHPKLKQGYSLGLALSMKTLFWAHTDGSLKIDMDDFNSEKYNPPIKDKIESPALIGESIFFIKSKNVFRVKNGKTELIFHSPKTIKQLQADKNFLMLSTKETLIQISPRGEVIKTIAQEPNHLFDSFKIAEHSFHCFLYNDGVIRSFDLNNKTTSRFALDSKFKILDYDCRGDIAVISSKDNLVLLARDKRPRLSKAKSTPKKL